MSLLTATPALESLANSLTATGMDVPSRTRLGEKDPAFAWTTGLPSIVARHVSTVDVAGSGYSAFQVVPAGTPGSVAEGGTKDTLATGSFVNVSVKKYAGLASLSTEQHVQTDAAVAAFKHVLTQQVLKAYDADCIAAMVADADATGSGSTFAAAILDGIANVISNGGNPDLIIMSGADYATAVESPGSGYLLDPRSGVPSLFGLSVGLATGAAAGESFVLDSSAVTCGDAGAYSVIDPLSGLSTNAIRLAVEFFGSVHVSAPGAVAALSVA